jgi:hypothetical protein
MTKGGSDDGAILTGSLIGAGWYSRICCDYHSVCAAIDCPDITVVSAKAYSIQPAGIAGRRYYIAGCGIRR